MKSESMKSVVIINLFWKLMERGGTQGIQFIVQIILARLLLPEEYGIIAIVTIFITLAGIFVDSGLNTALIQKKDADKVDFSSVFWVGLALAALLYGILFIVAPFLAVFFHQPGLPEVIRILSITLFLGVFNSIQQAMIAIRMEFKKLLMGSMGSVIVSGFIGVGMAYMGFGIWALVGQQISYRIIGTLILLVIVDWKPSGDFSFNRFKKLYSFGWKLLVSSLINTLYHNLRTLIIGKIYEPALLGFYDRGTSFPGYLITNINGSIQSVLFPALASCQENQERVRSMIRRSVVTSSFIIFPMMAGLAILAEPMIRVLLTDKWLPAVPFLQMACASYGLWPVHTANLQAINALGRSDIFLRLEIIKMIMGLIVLAISIPFGIYAIAFGGIVNGVISTFINASPNKKLLGYGYRDQLRDIGPSLLLSIIMAGIVGLVVLLDLEPLPHLLIGILTGILSYTLMAALLKLECYIYLLNTLKEFFQRRKRGEDHDGTNL